jgi:hemoglobin
MRLLLVMCLSLVLLCPATSAEEKKKTLFERLGGTYAIAALTDDFVDRLLSDDVIVANEQVVAALQPTPFNKVPGLKFHITALICHLTGGPENYTGRTMEASHKHLAINEAEWNATVADLKASLDKFKICPEDQKELLELVASTKGAIVTK